MTSLRFAYILICVFLLSKINVVGQETLELAIEKATNFSGKNTDWEMIVWHVDDIEMVLVPVGCFNMGSTTGFANEVPVHEVCFEKPFWIDRYEITTNQFIGNTLKEASRSAGSQSRDMISWYEANEFCVNRNGRLPTESEWEYAARGPSNWIYPWGDTFSDQNLDRASWIGAYDMSGNLWEWTVNEHTIYGYVQSNTNGQTHNRFQILRGGSFLNSPYFLRTTTRSAFLAQGRSFMIGLRCVRDISPNL